MIILLVSSSFIWAKEYLVTEVEWKSQEPISRYAQRQLNKLRREFSSKTVVKDFINEAVLNLGLNYISYEVVPIEDSKSFKIVFNFLNTDNYGFLLVLDNSYFTNTYPKII